MGTNWILFALIGTCCYCADDIIRQKMEADDIVPKIIPEAPDQRITVVYSGGKEVDLGVPITPQEIHEIPKVSFNSTSGKYYTFVLIDPDAPRRDAPIIADLKYWLVVNIPGNDLNSGEIKSPYTRPRPFVATGIHRLIFVVYEQTGKLNFTGDMNAPPASRQGWSLNKFVERFNLGKPYAGNYFNCEQKNPWDN